jgi:fatty-acyl-CoA synthase
VTAETYGALLQKQAGEHGGTTALIDDERAVTFAELDGRTRRLSAGLAGLGLRRGDVVAVWLPNTIEWAQTALAAGLLGVITLGVNTKLRSHDVQQLLAESGAKVLITYPGFKGIDFLGMLAEIGPALPPSLTHIVHIRSAELQGTDGLASQALVAYEDLFGSVPLEYQASDVAEIPAQAFTSSGSTGRPKIILHDQRGLLFHGHAVAERFGYRAQDAVVFGTLPLCGVFGFNTLLASLAAGRTLVLQAVFNAEEALRLVERHRITHMNLADGMLRMLLDAVGALDDPARISTWREAAFGNFTATDPMEMIRVGGRLGKKFYQTYGSSEVLALMTYPAQGSTPERWALGGGEPVSEAIEVRVRDAETGRPWGPRRDRGPWTKRIPGPAHGGGHQASPAWGGRVLRHRRSRLPAERTGRGLSRPHGGCRPAGRIPGQPPRSGGVSGRDPRRARGPVHRGRGVQGAGASGLRHPRRQL